MRAAATAYSLPLLGPLALLTACGAGKSGTEIALLGVPRSPANFTARPTDDPRFPLKLGTQHVYEGTAAEGFEHIEVDVTRATRAPFGGVYVEAHDKACLNASLVEDPLDGFAPDTSGKVWRFGEDTKQSSGGVVVGTESSWEAGNSGTLPGVITLAAPTVGVAYGQEFVAPVAQDRALVTSLADPVVVPGGSTPRASARSATRLSSPASRRTSTASPTPASAWSSSDLRRRPGPSRRAVRGCARQGRMATVSDTRSPCKES